MKNTLETRLGVFIALAVVASAIILEMIGGIEFFKGGTNIQARFNSILDLKKGDPVKMAGVPIGRVNDIAFADDKVLVTMRITDPKASVRTSSKASIKFTGLMGQNYVAIEFGSGKGAPAGPDFEITTYEQPDMSMLMTKLEAVAGGIKKMTDNFSDSNLNDLILPFTDFLKESRPRIMGILTNTEYVTAQIRAGTGTVGKLINDDTLYTSAMATVTNLSNTATDIQDTVKAAKAVVADIGAGKGTLGKLTHDEQLYTETTTAITNLKEILQKINQGQGSVGKIVNDDSLFSNAKMTLQKLDKATEGLEDQGPLSVLGLLANHLF